MKQSLKFSLVDLYSRKNVRSGEDVYCEVEIPGQCPQCKCKIAPSNLPSCFIKTKDTTRYTAVFICPDCMRVFTATYEEGNPIPLQIAPQAFDSRTFEKSIAELSPGFVKTYNQALIAEQTGLDEITGMAYRKALEYLMKDYLIMRAPDKEESIRAELLGSCINNRVKNERLRISASRAVWVGNEFVHYTRKYAELDIDTMKRFIDATIHWIAMELATDEAMILDRR